MSKFLRWIFFGWRPTEHVWKEENRITLGSYTDWGSCPQEITTMFRIGIYEVCLLTGDRRIREELSIFPYNE